MWPGLTLYFLIDHSQNLVTFLKNLKAYFLLGIGQDSVEAFHFVQLVLLAPAPVPSPLQLPDGLVQEGDKELHRGELGSVGVHLCFVFASRALLFHDFHATSESYLK